MSQTYRGTGVAGSSGTPVPSQADLDAAVAAAQSSATNAAASEGAAETSENNAATSETNAAASESAAGVSETNSAASASAASTSETNAGASETAAALSESNAATSETNAAASAAASAANATYENLDANGDIGTGATQVSQGDHTHDDRYYTETELDAGQLDNRYYTETEVDANTYSRTQLDGGQLDTRYYTETEVDATFQKIAATHQQGGSSNATTSGTTHDWTGIPSWAQRVSLVFNQVSLSGADLPQLLLGDAGGFETTGYISTSNNQAGTGVTTTTSISLSSQSAAGHLFTGIVTFQKESGTSWAWSAVLVAADGTVAAYTSAGIKGLSGALTQVRLQANGANTFDNGVATLWYE